MADAHCGQRCILDTAADGYAAYQQRLPKLAGIQLRATATIEIDATAPLSQVVRQLEDLI